MSNAPSYDLLYIICECTTNGGIFLTGLPHLVFFTFSDIKSSP
jgi:hypothetical protein